MLKESLFRGLIGRPSAVCPWNIPPSGVPHVESSDWTGLGDRDGRSGLPICTVLHCVHTVRILPYGGRVYSVNNAPTNP